MCFIYEQEYKGQCWDFLFFSEEPQFTEMPGIDGKPVSVMLPGSGESLVDMLRDVYNVKIVHEPLFKEKIMALFIEMHETGVIAPMETK